MKKTPLSPKTHRQLFNAFYALLCLLIVLWSTTVAEPFFGTPLPQHDAPAKLYASSLQNDLRGALIQAIRSAKRSVWLMVYSLSDRAVLHALRDKAAEGVPTHVIVDATATPEAAQLLGPHVKTTLRASLGLMHLKILVIDEEQIWCGSANMTHDSLYLHQNLILAMHHPELAEAMIARGQQLTHPGKSPHIAPLFFALGEQGRQKGEFWFLPQPKLALRRLCDLIETAKKTIKVAMFTWTHPALTDAVIAAHHRGVHVEVCVDRQQSHGAGNSALKRLCDAGIPVRTNHGTALLHHKLLWMDETVLVCGSANWTRAALKSNDDFFIVLSPLDNTQIASMRLLWRNLRKETSHVPKS